MVDAEKTRVLVKALTSVGENTQRFAFDLALGEVTPAKQRQFAGLLLELSNLLHTHANECDDVATSHPAG